MLIAYLPRFYYLKILLDWNCRGGKTKDGVADREAIVKGLNALILSYVLDAVISILFNIFIVSVGF